MLPTLQHAAADADAGAGAGVTGRTRPDTFQDNYAYDADVVKTAAAAALITPAQSAFLHETLAYSSVVGGDAPDDDAWKRYRLSAKRRLLHQPENLELKGLSKTDLKVELQTLYEDLVERMRALLKACKRL
jgi:hypothetical protein